MTVNRRFEEIDRELAAASAKLTPEAVYYWRCHQPRFRYMMELLGRLDRPAGFPRILDVGMGFQTLLLRKMYPASRVDCLGVYEDERYIPAPPYTFHNADLNEAALAGPAAASDGYDLIVFMEVLEHLYISPVTILRHLASHLRDSGLLVVTTPNAAWLKNRLKLAYGKNPFEPLKDDRRNMGHIREYTLSELEGALASAGLKKVLSERRGLYRFNNPKDNLYSWIADTTHPSLRRTLVAVYTK